jgi:hypothetical protein
MREVRRKIPVEEFNTKFPRDPGVYSNKGRPGRKVKKPPTKKVILRESDPQKILNTKKKPNSVRKSTNEKLHLLKTIRKEIEFRRERIIEIPPLNSDPLLPLIEVITKAADKRKANYIHAMRVFYCTEIAHWMLVIEGNSKAQNNAIAAAIEVLETYHFLFFFELFIL